MRINNRYHHLCLVLLLFLFIHSATYAKQDTTKTYFQTIQDVFNTELVYPQEQNEVQLTIMPEFFNSGNVQLLVPFIAEYGITNNWQIELEWIAFQNIKPENNEISNGIGDLEIGTMYSLMNVGQSDFHMAAGFDFEIPTGNEEKGLGEGNWKFEPYFLSALDIPGLNNMQVFSKIGLGFALNDRDDDPRKKEFNIGGGFFSPFNKIVLVSEINWYKEDDWDLLLYTPGIIVNLPGGWEAGFGMPIGINKNMKEISFKAIMTYEFNLLRDND